MKIIKYNMIAEVEVNVGTEDEPIYEIQKQKGTPVEIRCGADALESNLAVARAEAYEEPIVENDGQPDPVPEPTTDEILNALLGVTE